MVSCRWASVALGFLVCPAPFALVRGFLADWTHWICIEACWWEKSLRWAVQLWRLVHRKTNRKGPGEPVESAAVVAMTSSTQWGFSVFLPPPLRQRHLRVRKTVSIRSGYLRWCKHCLIKTTVCISRSCGFPFRRTKTNNCHLVVFPLTWAGNMQASWLSAVVLAVWPSAAFQLNHSWHNSQPSLQLVLWCWFGVSGPVNVYGWHVAQLSLFQAHWTLQGQGEELVHLEGALTWTATLSLWEGSVEVVRFSDYFIYTHSLLYYIYSHYPNPNQ